ncbi:MAG: DUF1801 domain-containing protein [Bacteroidales bacterium]|nr:DUF1801 domain-containing protein [Bacteroidales bacterium]
MNMFAKNDAKSIEEYLIALPDNRKKEINFLHEYIKKTVPGLKPYFASNMIGYGSFQYLDSKKRKMDWPIIALANQKNYISIYICAISDGKYVAEKYEKELGKVSVGRSCIRVKKIDDLNLETLTTVLKVSENNPGLIGAKKV